MGNFLKSGLMVLELIKVKWDENMDDLGFISV